MLKLISNRLLYSLITLIIIVVVVFITVDLLPSDMAAIYLGREATAERLAALRAELGLDRPAIERFMSYSGDVLQGDLGMSLSRKKPVLEVIGFRFRNTMLLGVSAALVGIPLALGLGTIAGLTRDRAPDLLISTITMIAMTLPEFVTATFLILTFSISLKLFPAVTIFSTGAPIWEFLPNIVLPIVTLTLVMVAHILRTCRTCIIDVMTSDYIQMATLKGIPYTHLVLHHALPNAFLPVISITALTIAWLISGQVIIEVVFNYPGLGTLLVDAIHTRDMPLIQGIALVTAGIYVLINLAADVLTQLLNPRLRVMRETQTRI